MGADAARSLHIASSHRIAMSLARLTLLIVLALLFVLLLQLLTFCCSCSRFGCSAELRRKADESSATSH